LLKSFILKFYIFAFFVLTISLLWGLGFGFLSKRTTKQEAMAVLYMKHLD